MKNQIITLFIILFFFSCSSKKEITNDSNKQVGQQAYVDFYVEGFNQDASSVVLKAGQKYRIRTEIGNICENKEYIWSIWGANPTSPSTSDPEVVYNTPGTYSIELILRTSHVGGGSVCSSNGSKKKTNYVRVIRSKN